MHSWLSSLRKTTTHARSVFTKSNTAYPFLGHSRKYYKKNESQGGDSSMLFESLLRSVSYGIVVCSSLGLCFSYSFYVSSDSFVSYADSGRQGWVSEKKPTSFLFKDTYRRKVFFKYEKRIRTRSPPEKVFAYFASIKTPQVQMTAADLMRAVVPVFPPSEADVVRAGNLKGELVTSSDLRCPASQFFMLFDTDNDGLISFPEYIFFVTILSIPESSFSVAFKMFDIDNDGGIDKQEFKKVMSLMRTQNRQGASHRDGMRSGSTVSSGPVEDGGLLEYFFGKDGTQRLGHDRFVQFLRDLHNEMLRLEFAHYDYKSRGTISAKDFVLSMVASADMSYINKFLDQVDELDNEPALNSIRITFEEFKTYAELRKSLEPFSMALFSYGKVNGLLSKQDFKRAAHQVCGISLTDRVVDLVFYMFDANRDGNLSLDEFLGVLERRETDISQPREGGLGGLLACWLECTKNNCSSMKKF